jgi:hypothetical protein
LFLEKIERVVLEIIRTNGNTVNRRGIEPSMVEN